MALGNYELRTPLRSLFKEAVHFQPFKPTEHKYVLLVL